MHQAPGPLCPPERFRQPLEVSKGTRALDDSAVAVMSTVMLASTCEREPLRHTIIVPCGNGMG